MTSINKLLGGGYGIILFNGAFCFSVTSPLASLSAFAVSKVPYQSFRVVDACCIIVSDCISAFVWRCTRVYMKYYNQWNKSAGNVCGLL